MSLVGTFRTFPVFLPMSVLQGKADLAAGRGILNNSENNPERKSFARKVKLVLSFG